MSKQRSQPRSGPTASAASNERIPSMPDRLPRIPGRHGLLELRLLSCGPRYYLHDRYVRPNDTLEIKLGPHRWLRGRYRTNRLPELPTLKVWRHPEPVSLVNAFARRAARRAQRRA